MAFADWDESCHGPIDDDDTRRAYPDNYTWSCCEASGGAEGCVKSIHTVGSKRQRVST